MSSSRGVEYYRRPGGDYPTPPELAYLIADAVDYYLETDPRAILEPGCGAGHILHAIAEHWPQATRLGIEIDPQLAFQARRRHPVLVADVLETPGSHLWASPGSWDLILGNPPFFVAEEFLARLLPLLQPTGRLAFVLRLNFLAGRRRYEELFSRHRPERVLVLPSRPGFLPGGGTDSCEYMVILWRVDPARQTALDWLDNTHILNRHPKEA